MSNFVMDGYRRKSLRRSDHDYYLTNVYFITIRVHERQPLLGSVEQDGVHINAAGRMVLQEWQTLRKRFAQADPGIIVIMPDHIHCILVIDPNSAGLDPCGIERSIGLPQVMQAFKSLTTRYYCAGVRQNGWPEFNGKLWQRNYHEHIVRSQPELDNITNYIKDNPARLWRSVYDNINATHHLE